MFSLIHIYIKKASGYIPEALILSPGFGQPVALYPDGLGIVDTMQLKLNTFDDLRHERFVDLNSGIRGVNRPCGYLLKSPKLIHAFKYFSKHRV